MNRRHAASCSMGRDVKFLELDEKARSSRPSQGPTITAGTSEIFPIGRPPALFVGARRPEVPQKAR
jgi:hypothetical protein